MVDVIRKSNEAALTSLVLRKAQSENHNVH